MALDLAGEFGAWNGTDDLEQEQGEATEDDETLSEDDAECEERLVGKRRRWAPTKGLEVELSAEGRQVLAKDPTKFYEGKGTIRYVSMDGSEAQVEWDCNPVVNVSYPTGYKDLFYLRLYEQPVVKVVVGNDKQRKGRVIKFTHDPEKYAELRMRREQEREKRRQAEAKKLEHDQRPFRRESPATPASRLESRGSHAATPSTAHRQKTAVSLGAGSRSGGTPGAGTASVTCGAGSRSRGVATAPGAPTTTTLSSRGRGLESDVAQSIIGPHMDDLQHTARSCLENLIGAEKQLERAAIEEYEREQLFVFFSSKFLTYFEDVVVLADAGNVALKRCRKAAGAENHRALNEHIYKARSYFALADQICILLRRVRKLAYLKAKSLDWGSILSGDLPLVPVWGGKLGIQAEMEITKVVASLILVHKMREAERVRSLSEAPSTPLPVSPVQGWNSPVISPHPEENLAKEKSPKNRLAENLRKGKRLAVTSLINQPWADPAFPGIPNKTYDVQHQDTRLKMQQHNLERSDEIVNLSIRRNSMSPGISRSGSNVDREKYLEREYVRDLQTANKFLNRNHDHLFAATYAASHGGAGSLAVLLNTLDSQAEQCTFVQGNTVLDNVHDLNLHPSHDSSNRNPSNVEQCATRFLSFSEDPNLEEGPQIVKVFDQLKGKGLKDERRRRWKSSGRNPSSSPIWGPDSWRGDKLPREIHGPTRTFGVYNLIKFLKPSKESEGAFIPPLHMPVVSKTPASDLKLQGFFPRDTQRVSPKRSSMKERKDFVTGPLHGDEYTEARRKLFTRDNLQKQYNAIKTPEHGVKVWPPPYPEESTPWSDGVLSTGFKTHLSPYQEVSLDGSATSPTKRTTKFQSLFLNEVQEIMGPYMNRTCARTNTPLTDNSGEERTHLGSKSKGQPMHSPKSTTDVLHPTSPELELRLQVRRDEGRPPTREYQNNFLQQIERRISEHTERVVRVGVQNRGGLLGGSVSALPYTQNFERGLTPKLVREGYRSRSVLGTTDTGWSRFKKFPETSPKWGSVKSVIFQKGL